MTSASEGTGAWRRSAAPPRRSRRSPPASSAAPPTRAPSTSGSAEQLGGVAGLDRAAVEDPHLVGGRAARAQHVADERARLLGLLGGRDAAGADRPDRLVGDHDLGDVASARPRRGRPAAGAPAPPRSRRRRAPPRSRRRRGSARGRRPAPPAPCGASASSVSPKNWRRSEWPRTTASTSSSTSIGAETSPVKAPDSSSCMFWAATLTAVPRRRSTTSVQRRERRADDDVVLGRGDPRQQRVDELGRLGDRLVHLPVGGDVGRAGISSPRRRPSRRSAPRPRAASFPPSSSKRGAAAGREPVDLVVEAELAQRRDRVAAADHGRCRAPRRPPRRPRGCRPRRAPSRRRPSARSRARCRRRRPPRRRARRSRADVEAHPAVGHLDPVDLAALGLGVELAAEHEVDRQDQLAVGRLGLAPAPRAASLDALLLDQRVAGRRSPARGRS